MENAEEELLKYFELRNVRNEGKSEWTAIEPKKYGRERRGEGMKEHFRNLFLQ